jgi:hypothetical protein
MGLNINPYIFNSFAPIGLIANAAAGSVDGGSTSVTGAIDTSGSSLLVVAALDDGSTTITDSKGNTWTLLNYIAANHVGLWYAANPVVGSGHTFTVSTVGFSPIAVQAFSNVKLASPLDGAGTGAANAGSATIQPGSKTPSEDNCLLVTASMNFGGVDNSTSFDSGFTKTDALPFAGGQNYAIAMGYKVQNTAGPENPTITWNASAGVGAQMAAFKHA